MYLVTVHTCHPKCIIYAPLLYAKTKEPAEPRFFISLSQRKTQNCRQHLDRFWLDMAGLCSVRLGSKFGAGCRARVGYMWPTWETLVLSSSPVYCGMPWWYATIFCNHPEIIILMCNDMRNEASLLPDLLPLTKRKNPLAHSPLSLSGPVLSEPFEVLVSRTGEDRSEISACLSALNHIRSSHFVA